MSQKPIKNALISVFYKDGVEAIAKALHTQGVNIYSTGGTEKYLLNLGIPVIKVEELTAYPPIFGGRVKTLHPKIFGGILYRRNLEADVLEAEKYEIPALDLVVIDLYPFSETVLNGGTESEIVEKIDIGGVSLIRAAAKNFADTTILSHKNQYQRFLNIYTQQKATNLAQRKQFALEAFQNTSEYDTTIHNYFGEPKKELRYGENPHQKAFFQGNFEGMFIQHNGKELSYNNLLDLDASVQLIDEFEEPTFAIVKHNNACGVASRNTIHEAWTEALSCDPISAFGGVLIANREIDLPTAKEIQDLFFELLIAPSYTPEALTLLQTKQNRIILERKETELPPQNVRSVLNGILIQQKDDLTDDPTILKAVTHQKASDLQTADLLFASKICKHTKSNAIVLVKNKKLLGSGTGQTSRIDALNQAIAKAKYFKFDLTDAAMASDAFFPFPDCVEIAKNAGISSIIQPGGSIKDQLSIDYCNEANLAMVMTGIRHFKH